MRVAPFPSDHRGVLSTLRVVPARSPVLVAAAERRVTIGDRLAVSYHAPRGSVVALADGHGGVVDSARVAGDGVVRLRTARLTTGADRVLLLGAGGRVLSAAPVWAYRPGTPTTVGTLTTSYRVGEPIGVRWAAAPGMALDWISVFRCAASCAPTSDYLVYVYTGTRIEGRAAIGPGALGGNASWPLPPGTYVVRLLPDDGYRSAARSARFTITA